MTDPTFPSKPLLYGSRTLIMGDAGTGKTRSIGTAVEWGIANNLEVFYVGIETGMESLIKFWSERGKPVPPNLHWAKLEAPKLSFKDLAAIGTKVNTLNYENLGKMQDPDRWKYDGLIKLNELLFNFKDDRTGKEFGDVSTWGVDRMLVIDGLTGMSSMAMNLVVGGKPIKNPGDYGIAQGQILPLLRLICDHCPCHFALLAHVEKEIDQVYGGLKVMPATIGQKLAPLLAPMFADVLTADRDGVTWTWSTLTAGATTKARYLPWKDKQAPDFSPLLNNWKREYEAANASEPAA